MKISGIFKYILVALLFSASSSYAATLSGTKIGPSRTFTAPSGVGTVYTTTPLVETGLQALKAFGGNFNPINIAGIAGAMVVMHVLEDAVGNKAHVLPGQNSPGIAPDGWTGANSPPPTATAGSRICWEQVETSATCRSTIAEAGQAIAASYNPASYGTCMYIGNSGYTVEIYCDTGYHPFVNTHLSTTCAAGYIVQNGQCILNNPSAVMWPSDGVPTYQMQGGQLVGHPRDPDSVGVNPPALVREGEDQFGNPGHESITPNPDGGTTIRRREQTVNPQNGQPLTQETGIQTDANGVVTNHWQQTYNSTVNNTTVTNTTTTQAPTDVSALNKEATQLQIKDLLDPAKMTQPDTSTATQALETKMQDKANELLATDTNLSANPAATTGPVPFWEYASGTCYPKVLGTFRGTEITLATFCQIYDAHIRAWIVWVVGVFGMLHAWAVWRETVREL